MSILLPLLRLSGRVDQAPTASDFDGVSGFLRRHVALGFASRAADDLFVEDVVTFTMDKATMGSSGFRGSTEGEAITFLRRVASNRAIDLIRKAERRASAEERRPPPEVMAAESFELKAADLERIFGMIAQQIPLLHSRRTDEVRRRCRIFLNAQTGLEDIERQIERWETPSGESFAPKSAEWLRARDRVYQHRRRGRLDVAGALAALRRAGRIDEDDLHTVARQFGLSRDLEHLLSGDWPA